MKLLKYAIEKLEELGAFLIDAFLDLWADL